MMGWCRSIRVASFWAVLFLACGGFSAVGQDIENAREAAEKALEERDFQEAIRQFSLVLEEAPEDVDAYLGRSEAYGRKGELDSAMADSEEAIRLDPTNARAHWIRGAHELAYA